MAVDFSALVYNPNQDFWSRPFTVYPLASQPTAPDNTSYDARGILDTQPTVIDTGVGFAVGSDQQTILDIREREFGIPPVQGDIIDIPADGDITEGVGQYEVVDAAWNGGGEITLTLRKMTQPTPIGP